MDYDQFTILWHQILEDVRFPNLHFIRPIETIDTRSMDRNYKVFLMWPETPATQMFGVSAEISWTWDALLSGRFATTEEDMLMQIYGDFGIHEDTEPPWLRVDVTLSAAISLDKRFPLPLLANWQRWVASVYADIDPVLPADDEDDENDLGLIAWRGEPEAIINLDSQGHSYLQQIRLPAWQGIILPRQWDDPDKGDPGPDEQLYDLVSRLQQALKIWQESLVYLIED